MSDREGLIHFDTDFETRNGIVLATGEVEIPPLHPGCDIEAILESGSQYIVVSWECGQGMHIPPETIFITLKNYPESFWEFGSYQIVPTAIRVMETP